MTPHALTEFGLSLGTNVGDRLLNLTRARQALADTPGLTIAEQSGVYETEPVAVDPVYCQQQFLNAVLIVRSTFSPAQLAERAHAIEAELGRRRTTDRNAPRPIDVDIIYADARTVHEEGLIIPHPRWHERRFVVQPLAEVRPDIVLPGRDETVAEQLLSLPTRPRVILFRREW